MRLCRFDAGGGDSWNKGMTRDMPISFNPKYILRIRLYIYYKNIQNIYSIGPLSGDCGE